MLTSQKKDPQACLHKKKEKSRKKFKKIKKLALQRPF